VVGKAIPSPLVEADAADQLSQTDGVLRAGRIRWMVDFDSRASAWDFACHHAAEAANGFDRLLVIGASDE
jgi:hypothetical protein